MARKKRYRLFAMEMDSYNVAVAAKNRFHRITPDYILVYRRGTADYGEIEVKGDDLRRLAKMDREWLSDCNAALLAEASEDAATDTAERLRVMIDELEAALREERDRCREEADGSETEQ